MLEGSEGLGCWKELHAQLVARRNRLVAQLGEAFQVRGVSLLSQGTDSSCWGCDSCAAWIVPAVREALRMLVDAASG